VPGELGRPSTAVGLAGCADCHRRHRGRGHERARGTEPRDDIRLDAEPEPDAGDVHPQPTDPHDRKPVGDDPRAEDRRNEVEVGRGERQPDEPDDPVPTAEAPVRRAPAWP
jgi:hypothetical protein